MCLSWKGKCFFVFIPVLIFLFLVVSSAESLKGKLFSKDEVVKLRRGKILSRAVLRGKGAVATSSIIKIPKILKINGAKLLTDEYDMVALEKIFFKSNTGVYPGLLNALLDNSKIKGLKYYSRTSGRMKILIVDSYTMDMKKNNDSGGVSYSSSFLIEDNNLGRMVFRSTTKGVGNNLFQISVLQNRVRKFGFQIFKPGDYRIVRALIYSKKHSGYFYYSMSLMKVRSSIMNRFNLITAGSFGNRVRADTVNLLGKYDSSLKRRIAAFR